MLYTASRNDPNAHRGTVLDAAAGGYLSLVADAKLTGAWGWVEVTVPADGGVGLVTSDELERAIRRVAEEKWPLFDLRGLRVQLCWQDTRGSRFVCQGAFRPI